MLIDKKKQEKKEFDFSDSNYNYIITVIASDLENAKLELLQNNFDVSNIDFSKTLEISSIYGVKFNELEIEARLNFIKETLLEVFQNHANINFNIAFNEMSQKNAHYNEAFIIAKELIQKEFSIPLPSNRMSESKEDREKFDRIKDKLLELCNARGSDKFRYFEKTIVYCLREIIR